VRLIVLGGTGMLGRATVLAARRRGWAAFGPSHGQLDVCDTDAVRRAAADFGADVLFNAAAFTQVDRCETEPALAHAVNAEAVAGLAAVARERGARLVHVSSDYVFDGTASTPYVEEAPTAPLSVYGASKLGGERSALGYEDALVVRTSWVFGPGGANFVATIRRLLAAGQPLRVVDDQHGRPTYAPFLAEALLDLLALRVRGLFHYANREPVSWYGFARTIADLEGASQEITPITTADMPRPARRPAYSVLALERVESLLGRRVEPWIAGLVDYLSLLRRRSS
jgi:dTDP-4-dehydrorhamnose reductase